MLTQANLLLNYSDYAASKRVEQKIWHLFYRPIGQARVSVSPAPRVLRVLFFIFARSNPNERTYFPYPSSGQRDQTLVEEGVCLFVGLVERFMNVALSADSADSAEPAEPADSAGSLMPASSAVSAVPASSSGTGSGSGKVSSAEVSRAEVSPLSASALSRMRSPLALLFSHLGDLQRYLADADREAETDIKTNVRVSFSSVFF